jgi:hypothetical protein
MSWYAAELAVSQTAWLVRYAGSSHFLAGPVFVVCSPCSTAAPERTSTVITVVVRAASELAAASRYSVTAVQIVQHRNA